MKIRLQFLLKQGMASALVLTQLSSTVMAANLPGSTPPNGTVVPNFYGLNIGTVNENAATSNGDLNLDGNVVLTKAASLIRNSTNGPVIFSGTGGIQIGTAVASGIVTLANGLLKNNNSFSDYRGAFSVNDNQGMTVSSETAPYPVNLWIKGDGSFERLYAGTGYDALTCPAVGGTYVAPTTCRMPFMIGDDQGLVVATSAGVLGLKIDANGDISDFTGNVVINDGFQVGSAGLQIGSTGDISDLTADVVINDDIRMVNPANGTTTLQFTSTGQASRILNPTTSPVNISDPDGLSVDGPVYSGALYADGKPYVVADNDGLAIQYRNTAVVPYTYTTNLLLGSNGSISNPNGNVSMNDTVIFSPSAVNGGLQMKTDGTLDRVGAYPVEVSDPNGLYSSGPIASGSWIAGSSVGMFYTKSSVVANPRLWAQGLPGSNCITTTGSPATPIPPFECRLTVWCNANDRAIMGYTQGITGGGQDNAVSFNYIDPNGVSYWQSLNYKTTVPATDPPSFYQIGVLCFSPDFT